MSLTSRALGPFRRSLRARLVGYFVGLSTITVLVVGVIVYARATSDLTTSVYERLDAVAGLKADALDRWIDEQSRNVVFIGVMPRVGDDARVFLHPASDAAERDAAEDDLRQVLATVVSQTADAEEIFVMDLDGTIRMSTLAEHEGLSQAEEGFFVTGSSHTNVQNVYRSSLTGRPTITVASPLFDQDGRGQRVGVIAANLSLQRVDRIVLERTGLGTSGRAYLVGTDGVLIQGAGADGAALDSSAITGIIAGQSGHGLYADPNGTPVIGVYSWIEERRAGLIAEMSQEEAFSPARQLALVIAIVGLVSAILLAAGTWIVARRVTRPILSLAATASRVRAGDLEAKSGVSSDDEVGILATAFDDMTAELRENVVTLERRVDERTAEIRRQKAYFEALVGISPVAVVTMDRDEVVSGWNPAAVALFGYASDDAIGKHIDDLLFSPDERGVGKATTRLADETGRAQLIGRRRRKDGETVDVEIALVPLVVDGEHTGYYAIYHDITELEVARRDADAANQAKSAFLAAMSHEIRTPMNAVIGMSGLLLGTKLDDEQRDFTESISVSGEALLTIINDILDFSKIEAGRFELESLPFDLRKTVDDAAGLIRPNAAKKGLDLTVSRTGEHPPLLLGDGGRVRQILLNLLSNALKFTEHGHVELTVATTPVDGRWQVDIAVTDTGIGISQDGIGRLFQSFSQADPSIARRYGGTGLGLAISRRLAELMGGTLTATSKGIPGEGSRFALVFTADAASADAMAAGGPGPERGAAFAAIADNGALRVLLAEDNPMNQKLALRLLRNMGISADVAASGLEAVAAIDREPYDLIFMDVQMPDMDGLEATRRIRAAEPAIRPWIVAMTANAMAGDREACLEAGMDGYLAKPIRPNELAAAIAAVPAGSGMARELGT
ncbi:MAG: response regulator [Candidatus Limnocylindrales bacterium]